MAYFELGVTHHPYTWMVPAGGGGNRGVPRIWEGGQIFFRFGNLHVVKRHAAHG